MAGTTPKVARPHAGARSCAGSEAITKLGYPTRHILEPAMCFRKRDVGYNITKYMQASFIYNMLILNIN